MTMRSTGLALVLLLAAGPALAQNETTINPNGGVFTRQPNASPRLEAAPEPQVLTAHPDLVILAPGPRYQVRIISFLADDETDIDLGSSDEVVTVLTTPAYKLIINEIGDVDSDGVPRRLDPDEQCIMPAIDNDGEYNHSWDCDFAGVPAPMSFTVGMWEQDSGPVFGFCATQWDETDLRPVDLELCETEDWNELIGVGAIEIAADDPKLVALEVGQTYQATKKIAYGCDQTQSGGTCNDNEPVYYITYTVMRVPNAL